MNLQFYLEKLKSSEEYKKFIKENPDAYLCSGFFVIDKIENDNKVHFDFYVPNTKKMFSFQLENDVRLVPIELFDDRVPEKIVIDYDFEFGEIERIVERRMQEEGIDKKIQKILLSLQKIDGKNFLIGTVFISGLGIIKVNIDVSEMKIVLFEKKSFFDMVRRVK